MLCVISVAWAARKPDIDEREHELSRLRSQLAIVRDSLQREIARRWNTRQRAVEQREIDKEEITRLNDEQEKAFNAVITAKEEGYSLEQRLETARKAVEEKQQEWRYTGTVLSDIFDKEARNNAGLFPLDSDTARLALKAIRSDFSRRNSCESAVRSLSTYFLMTLKRGMVLTTEKATVLPDGEDACRMTVARFGTVFGYGMCEDGRLYSIGQSGREGRDRYRITRIENPLLHQKIAERFGPWVAKKRPHGTVTVDIMQNNLSGMLLSGRKESVLEKMIRFVKAGGPVMFVLGVLPLWAIILIIIKILQFFGKKSSARKLFARLESYVEKNDLGGARQFLAKRQSEWTRAAAACFDTAGSTREGVENIAKESLSAVSSRLNSHLNTLAVIAGVAPLLGLLGTVTGMIRLFEVITHYGTGDPKLLAGGISEALVTTEVGLIIAVPVLLVHNFLRNYKRAILSEIQVGTLRIINRRYPET